MARAQRGVKSSKDKLRGKSKGESKPNKHQGKNKRDSRLNKSRWRTTERKFLNRNVPTKKKRHKAEYQVRTFKLSVKGNCKHTCIYCRQSFDQSLLSCYIQHLQSHRRLVWYPKSVQKQKSVCLKGPTLQRVSSRKKAWQHAVLSCRMCQKVDSFSNQKDVWNHEKEHEGGELFPCRFCHKKFFWLSFVTKHEASHLKIDRYQPCTAENSEEAVSKRPPKGRPKGRPKGSRKRKYPGRPGRPRKIDGVLKRNLKLPCEVCGKVLHSYYLKEHMTVHSNEMKYTCEICGRDFKWAKAYENHLKVHKPELRADFDDSMCSLCGKSFSRRSYLNIHERLYCTGTNKKRKPVNPSVKRKLKDCDTTHRCSLCPKEFVDRHYLRKHMKFHTNPLSMTCALCGKTYSSTHNLQRHMLSHRLNNQPYQCSFCEARFTQNSSRKAHERLHTGERPYKCKFCQKGFTQSSNKKTHEKRCKWRDGDDSLDIPLTGPESSWGLLT